ncbi:uncharacterized protein [Dysidea avara]|uniref:uncharacterized protein n=1 Tax=Dysidea avara TaxID=196820 RepID=UPI0033249ADA
MPAALIISLLLCAFATRTILAQATCKPVNGANKYCACSLVDGDGTAAGVVDLSLYGNRDRSYRFKSTSADRDYYYNPCYPLVLPDASDCKDGTAAGCQEDRQNGANTNYKIGNFDAVQYSVDADTNNVILVYTGGNDGREMKITLKCNPTVSDPNFAALGEPNKPKTYEFTLEGVCACPGACKSSVSIHKSSNDPGVVGIILLCLGLAAFVTYFIVGAVFLRVKHQKSGTDLIINKEFWKDFPFLIKDGVMFTFSPLCKLVNKEGSYSSFK